jgi:predicted O-methyltransferase YrrM
MNNLSEKNTNTNIGRLYKDFLNGPMKAGLMICGIRLGIFDALQTKVSAKEVASMLALDPVNTEIFLDSLCTIDLVEKSRSLYQNKIDTNAYLVKEKPEYIGFMLEFYKKHILDILDHLPELIKNGPNPGILPQDFSSPLFWAESTKNSGAWIIGGGFDPALEIITHLPEFNSWGKMLDLGGGSGLCCISIVKAHPDLKGVVFDQPGVIETTMKFIEKYSMENRIGTLAGNYFEDSIGQNYDLIFASATLNFAKQNLDPLFHKIFEALNPGGLFITFQDGMTHENTKPDVMLAHTPHALAAGKTMTFKQGQIADAMIRTGFKSVQSRTLKTPLHDMDLDIARK